MSGIQKSPNIFDTVHRARAAGENKKGALRKSAPS